MWLVDKIGPFGQGRSSGSRAIGARVQIPPLPPTLLKILNYGHREKHTEQPGGNWQ